MIFNIKKNQYLMRVFTKVNKFKQELLDSILTLLWKQWTLLGVAGAVNTKDDLVLDLKRC